MLHGGAQDGLLFGSKDGPEHPVKVWPRKEENPRLSSFPKCVAEMQLGPGITVNGCDDAAIQPRRAEEAGLPTLRSQSLGGSGSAGGPSYEKSPRCWT
jgi:hypothetical protein